MTSDELIQSYYQKLVASNANPEELKRLKSKRIHQIAQIRNEGKREQFEEARHYMAQVGAVEQRLKLLETDEKAQAAWRAVTGADEPEPQEPEQPDDFDAFLASLSQDTKREQTRPTRQQMTTREADAYFDDNRSAEKKPTETEYGDGFQPVKEKAQDVFEKASSESKHSQPKTAEKHKKENKDKTVGELTKKEKRSIRTVRVCIWIPIILAVLLCGMIVVNLFVLPFVNYRKAQSLYSAGEYDPAKTAFSELDDYRDSADMVNKCDYQAAKTLASNSKYQDAITLFGTIADYGDAGEQIAKCYYDWAAQCYDLDKYDDAIMYLEKASAYADSKTFLQKIYYERGISYMNDRDWDNAVAMFTAAETYQDSATMIQYVQALNLAADGDYSALEALRGTMDLDDLFVKIDAFNTVYENFIGTFQSANGGHTVKIYGCVVGDRVVMRYVGDFMPSGDFLPENCAVDADGVLTMTVDNGTCALTVTSQRNAIEVVSKRGDNEYDYTYTRVS